MIRNLTPLLSSPGLSRKSDISDLRPSRTQLDTVELLWISLRGAVRPLSGLPGQARQRQREVVASRSGHQRLSNYASAHSAPCRRLARKIPRSLRSANRGEALVHRAFVFLRDGVAAGLRRLVCRLGGAAGFAHEQRLAFRRHDIRQRVVAR